MNEICCLFMFLIAQKNDILPPRRELAYKKIISFDILPSNFSQSKLFTLLCTLKLLRIVAATVVRYENAIRIPYILLPTLLHFKSQQSSRRWLWRGRKKWTFIPTVAADCRRFCHRKVRHLLKLLQTRCVCDIWRYYLWSVDQNYGEWAWVLGTSFCTGKSLTRTHELFDSIFQLSFKRVECCVWNGIQLNRQKIN